MNTILYKNATAVINRYLRLDPYSFDQLKKLEGRIVQINITEPRLTAIVLFHASGVEIIKTCGSTIDTTITAPLAQLLKLKTSGNSGWNGIHIQGDMELAQTIYGIFKNMEIDWEEWISHGIGDIPAHRLGKTFRAARTWAKQSRHTFATNITEHLQFDGGFLVSRKEVNDFQTDVITLRNDVDRLETRLRLLMEQNHLCEK